MKTKYEIEFEYTLTGARLVREAEAASDIEAIANIEKIYGKEAVLLYAVRNLKQLYELGIR